jgi:hypothetical protein
MESASTRAETSLISPESIGPPPRKVQLTGKGIALALVAAIIIAIALLYACFIAREAARQLQIRTALRSAGNETMGQIESVRNPYHALKEYVDYSFIADGKTYTGEAIVPHEDYQSISQASSLAIRYLPENPSVNHPVDWEWSPMTEWDAYFVVILIAGLGCILFIPPQMQFQRSLARKGAVAIGVVTKCSVSGKWGEYITLRYEFRTQDGSAAQGRGSSQTRQEIGAKILILYLPQEPRRNVPYPLSSWRIASR